MRQHSDCGYKFSHSYLYPASSIKVHFFYLSRASSWNTKQCMPSWKWLSKLTQPALCVVLQCGRWCSRQRGGRLCGPQQRLQLHPSDPQRGARPRSPGQSALRTHLPAQPPEAPPTQASAFTVYPPQAGRGGGHQALPLSVWELWALIRPTGQAGKGGRVHKDINNFHLETSNTGFGYVFEPIWHY